MVGIIKVLGPQRAIEILDGRTPWSEPMEYLEAALYVSTHERTCREYMAAALYSVALHLSDYAVDHGAEAACKLIQDSMKRPEGAKPQ